MFLYLDIGFWNESFLQFKNNSPVLHSKQKNPISAEFVLLSWWPWECSYVLSEC